MAIFIIFSWNFWRINYKYSFIGFIRNPKMPDGSQGDMPGFSAQEISDTDAAAKYGVYLHGSAGDLAAQQKTQLAMTASDIIENISNAD